MEQLSHSETVTIEASTEAVYDLVSDIARTGQWSPTCVRCEWDDPAETGVGATFTGYNETPSRSWQTTSTVIAAERSRRFAWEVGKGYVRWSYDLHPAGDATELSETWTFLPAGLTFFGERYGENAAEVIDHRRQSAVDDIPRTLATLKQIAE
ncbi:MAG: SRPBCC family protein [Ornithinimicrobium sp.]